MYKNKIILGVFILAISLLGLKANIAEAATCNASTGNWNTVGTWSCGRVPLSTDDVVIPTAVTVTVDSTGAVAGTITFNDPVDSTNTITIASPGTLTVTGAVTWIGSSGFGNSILVVADGTVSAGGFHMSTGAGGGSSRIIYTTGTVTTTAGLTFIDNTGSNIISNSGAGHFNLTGTIPTDPDVVFTMDPGTVLTSTGTSAINNPYTLGKLQVASGTLTLGAAITVTGLQVDSGATLAAGANLVTDTGTGTGASGFTINGTFSGTAGATLSGVGATIDGTGTISNSGTLTLTGDKTISSTAILTLPGTVTISNFSTVTNNGTITTTGAGGIGGSLTTWTQGANSTLNFNGASNMSARLNASASGNTVSYSKAGDQTVKIPLDNYYNLTLDGSGIKAISTSLVIANDLLLVSSSLSPVILANSSTTTVGGGLKIYGSWKSANGTWGSSGSTATHKDDTYFAAANTGTVQSTLSHSSGTVTTTSGGGGGSTTIFIPTPVTPPTPTPDTKVTCVTGQLFNVYTGVKCNDWITPPTVSYAPVTYNLGTVTLAYGTKGEAVMELQKFLNAQLHLTLVVDGKLGPKTVAAIKMWQQAHGLVADGIVGPKTRAAMNAEAAK